ncbi:hypothetical protein VQ03_19465 [Methylobacterium tarhaniae]|uniref:ABM domain-containing protein n=1 Tax=Methylobacterium tarhaniae TaxID=1187852 RepID=A0A0J6SPW3_9HYPH|nr:hypothetical protein [Methylobacterium tarhaniae]KMO37270.1 hypothetical protein VQ03_19465 [Methylobacterium tarhaniae]
MPEPCYEIVVYEVGDAADADHARDRARTLLRRFPGFIAWTPFTEWDAPNRRADLVAWADEAHARAAATAVGTAPDFAGFRASVATLVSMSHYRAPDSTPDLEPRPVAAGAGVEVGRFRLKPGVREAEMRAAYAAMLAGLAALPGWRRQHLVRLADGLFLDLAFAEDQERSEAICAAWAGNPACDRFLALIEPESMEFGTIL